MADVTVGAYTAPTANDGLWFGPDPISPMNRDPRQTPRGGRSWRHGAKREGTSDRLSSTSIPVTEGSGSQSTQRGAGDAPVGVWEAGMAPNQRIGSRTVVAMSPSPAEEGAGCTGKSVCNPLALLLACLLTVAGGAAGFAVGRSGAGWASAESPAGPAGLTQALVPPREDTLPLVPMQGSPWRDDGFCNARASTGAPQRSPWPLGLFWRRACATRGAGKESWQHGVARNWCWAAIKSQCHRSMGAPKPWSDIRSAAAHAGDAPSVIDVPYEPLMNAALCDRRLEGEALHWTAQEKVVARAWFHSSVAVYLLGDEEEHHTEGAAARLKELGIAATHVGPVERGGGHRREAGAGDRGGAAAGRSDQEGAEDDEETEQQDNNSSEPASGNESRRLDDHRAPAHADAVGHWHFQALAEATRSDLPLVLVLEPGTIVAKDFVERLWHLVLNTLPCDWEVLSLSAQCPFGTCVAQGLARVQPDTQEPDWTCRSGVNIGLPGMLYRTSRLPGVRRKWRAAALDEQQPSCSDLDAALASIADEVGYYAVPAVQEAAYLAARAEARYSEQAPPVGPNHQRRPRHATDQEAPPWEPGHPDRPRRRRPEHATDRQAPARPQAAADAAPKGTAEDATAGAPNIEVNTPL